MNRRGFFSILAAAPVAAALPAPKSFASADIIGRASHTGPQYVDILTDTREFLDVYPSGLIEMKFKSVSLNPDFKPSTLLQLGSCAVGEDDGSGPSSEAYGNWFEHLV